MGEGFDGDLVADSPVAGDFRPASGSKWVWGRTPQRWTIFDVGRFLHDPSLLHAADAHDGGAKTF